MDKIILNIKDIKLNKDNPRVVKDDKFNKLVKSIKEFPQMLQIRPIVVNKDRVVLGGNMRLKACIMAGLQDVPVIIADEFSEDQEREFIIKDNIGYGEWDFDLLVDEWDTVQLEEWGLDLPEFNDPEDRVVEAHAKLTDSFIVPPFSVLDTRQGYWRDRKEHWHTIIGDKGESRENTLDSETGIMATMNNGVSLLDPVLSELVVKWFGLPKGNVFDCFAGDSVFGYVSSYLGNTFTGIELREEQVNLNNLRVKGFKATYICDDGQNVDKHIQPQSQDLLFSCPPYYDLEIYSDLDNDASNQGTYDEFLQILRVAFTKAITCLKDNRFAVITVGDLRDKEGYYYRFVDDIKNIFGDNDMPLYNELILVESIGTLPQRVGRYMQNRKIGKCHQNVLVFYKGDVNKIKEIYPKLDDSQDAQP